MVNDKNVRSLPAILLLAKKIIDAGVAADFIQGCQGRDELFVVGTDASRTYIADFLKQHNLDPQGDQLHNFTYGGYSQC
ncbi:hypothetical protein [Methylobacterium sp. 1030]|uniref:hypothetical protein n=1 Tax=Methylobacterium sp. 1030 TaxID=3156404 RepID=UPI00339B3F1C